MIKNNLTFFLKSLLLLLLLSCNNSKNDKKKIDHLENIISKNLGKTLNIPTELEMYYPFSDSKIDSLVISNSKYKIYTNIDASCGSCISQIKKWQKFAVELEKIKVPVILIFHSNDKFELLKFLCESNKIEGFPYPFFLDKKNEYEKLNKFVYDHESFKTTMTDTNNKILLFGNPLASKGIKEMYLSNIK
jgi:hypothetical protein